MTAAAKPARRVRCSRCLQLHPRADGDPCARCVSSDRQRGMDVPYAPDAQPYYARVKPFLMVCSELPARRRIFRVHLARAPRRWWMPDLPRYAGVYADQVCRAVRDPSVAWWRRFTAHGHVALTGAAFDLRTQSVDVELAPVYGDEGLEPVDVGGSAPVYVLDEAEHARLR